MQTIKIVIPDDISFSSLRLERDPDGYISFDLAVIQSICDASGLELETFTEASEDLVSSMIINWYLEHKRRGGEPNTVAEDLAAEVRFEDAAGQNFSHPAGRA